MSRHLWANTISLLVGGLIGLAAFGAYYQFLSTPRPFTAAEYQGALMDWAVDLGAGLSVGIIFFFAAWGHFQQEPDPTTQRGFPVESSKS